MATIHQRFDLGQLLTTPGALATSERHGFNLLTLMARHAGGDWGDIPAEDQGLNELALADGSRLLSVYGDSGSDACLWIITEAVGDAGRRAATTILRPDEY